MRLVSRGRRGSGAERRGPRASAPSPVLEITVLEKGSRISYGACGLPYLIEGQVASVDAIDRLPARKFEREREHSHPH